MASLKRKTWIIGLVTFVTLGALAFTYNYLQGTELFDDSHYYYVFFDEVDGLYKSNRVLINGMRVGQVHDISFASDGSGRLLVILQLDPEHHLQKITSASIVNTGLIGGRMIRLNDAYGPGPYMEPGDTIVGRMEPSYAEAFNLDFESILLRTDTLLQNLNRLTRSFNDVMDETGRDQIRSTLDHIERSSVRLHGVMERMPRVLVGIDSAAYQIGQAGLALQSMSREIESVTDSITASDVARVVERADRALESLGVVLKRIEAGEGTLGLLSQDDSLYIRAEATLAEVEALVDSVRNNPKKYLRISVF